MLLVVGSTPTNGSFPHLYPVYKKEKKFPPLSPIMCSGSCSHHGKKCCTTKDDQALWLCIVNTGTLCHHPTHDPALNKSFKMHKSETNKFSRLFHLKGIPVVNIWQLISVVDPDPIWIRTTCTKNMGKGQDWFTNTYRLYSELSLCLYFCIVFLKMFFKEFFKHFFQLR